MFSTASVVWREGLFLQPQHFQQSQRSTLSLVNSRIESLHPFGWGLLECELDLEALGSALVALKRCRAVLPDGAFVDMPQADPLPPARSVVERMPAEQQALDVYLGLPLAAEDRCNVAAAQSPDSTAARYRAVELDVADDVLGRGRKRVEVAVPAPVLLLAGEPLDGYAALRIARLSRTPAGRLAPQAAFVPPLLRIGACAPLVEELRGLLQLLMARVSALAAGRRQSAGGLAGFGPGEENSLRLLQTLNTYTPLLAHHVHAPQVHPWDLYCLLSQFCGALCTFSAEHDITSLPRYDHADPGATFHGLLGIVRAIVGADAGAACVSLPLEQLSGAMWSCTVGDNRLLSSGRFYLGVSARASEKEVVVGALQRIKLSSAERLELLVASAMPGLPIVHTPKPPDGLAAKPGFSYFALAQQGELWDGIRATRTMALHFPSRFPDVKLEMLALRS